jgi:hypothetical protein
MTIQYLASTPQEVGLDASAWSTSVTGRDTVYSAGSILALNQTLSVPIGVVSATDYWFHMRVYYNNVGTGTSSVQTPIIQFYDSVGNLIGEMWKYATYNYGIGIRLYGSSIISGPYFTPVTNTTYTYDIRLIIPGSGGTMTMEFYVNGTLHSSVTATNSGTVKGKPFIMLSTIQNALSVGSTGINYSEIIAATDESTINARLATLTPVSAGAFSEWTGSQATLADVDSASGVSVASNAKRFNSVFSAYGGPGTPSSIRGVFLKAAGSQAGAIAPTQLNQSLRIGGINYDGTAQAMVPGRGNIHEWAINPATSAAWLTANLVSLEGGLLSAA